MNDCLKVSAILFAFALPAVAADFPMERIHGKGRITNRVNILVVGDGWTAAEIAAGKYKTACEKLRDRLIAMKPFAEYKNLINITRVDVPSKESGCSHVLGNRNVDTYYGTRFSKETVNGKDQDDRGVWFRDWGKCTTALRDTNPRQPRNVTLVLINDATYGGAATFLGSAASGIGTVTTHPDSGDVFVHEIGHALMNLADEYDYGGRKAPATEPVEANVTITNDPKKVKWKHWIDAGVKGVGLVEGGQYATKGVWRPRDNCLMKALNQELCEVCLERTVQRFFENVSLIDEARSSLLPILLKEGDATSMFVRTVAPEKAKLEEVWYLDGKPVGGTKADAVNGPEFRIDVKKEMLRVGIHFLRFSIQDKTPLTADWPATVKTHAPSTKTWMITVRPTLPRLPFLQPAE